MLTKIYHRVSEDKRFELVMAADEDGNVTVHLGIGAVMISMFEDEYKYLISFLEEDGNG